MKKKVLLISIDTEGDDLWNWRPGKEITTQNTAYIRRFQELCDTYGFRPTYLTNYEMAADDHFVQFAKETLQYGGCEIGMHLHAWNQPPQYELPERDDGIKSGCPYLIEYPDDVMEQKIAHITQFLEERFGTRPIVHRAGRWATDSRYFSLLQKYGYLADCSVTPGMDWGTSAGFTNGSGGTDYTQFPSTPYTIPSTSILEIPVSIMKDHRIKIGNCKNIKHVLGSCYKAVKGYGHLWLRPNGKNLQDMLYLADRVYKSKSEYLMFMLHSSELMPGGSWVFDNEEKIEKLYADLKTLFAYISRNYMGMTIGNYAQKLKSKGKLTC